MKILISIGTLGLGGAEKQAVWLANQLSKTHETTLVTYTGGAREPELSNKVLWVELNQEIKHEKFIKVESNASYKNKFNRVRFKNWVKIKSPILYLFLVKLNNYVFNSKKLYINFRKTVGILNEFNPDVVITFLYHDTLLIGYALLFSNSKARLIVNRRSPMGYGDQSRTITGKILLRLVYFKSTLCISNSDANNANAVKEGINSSKILIIPNYIKNSRIKTIKTKLNSKIKIVNIANLIWYKNQFNLINALAIEPELRDNISLTIVGDGPLREELISLASKSKIDIDFRGTQLSVEDILEDSDAFILTSKFEGSSNSLLEALAIGLPCVSTPVGDAYRLELEGAGIILTDSTSAESIGVALKKLINDFSEINESANKFASIIQQKYSEKRILEKWNDAILKVIS